MASLYKFCFISSQKSFTRTSRLSPRYLVYARQFCSKENETNNSTVNSEDSSSKNSERKLDEKSTAESKVLSKKTEQFSSEQKEAAKQKLMSLLSEIEVSSDFSAKNSSNFRLARPLKRPTKKERLEEMEAKRITPEKEIKKAVKAVADNFKEDQEKIEAELTEKLSSLNLTKENAPEEKEAVDVTNSQIDNEVSEKLMSSVEEVAHTLSEKPIPPRSELAQRLLRLSLDKKDTSKIKKFKRIDNEVNEKQMSSVEEVSEKPIPLRSELTQRLLRLSLDKKDAPEVKKSMRSVIGNMKFEPNQRVPTFKRQEMERRQPVERRQPMERRKPIAKSITDRAIDLFGSSPLGIFKINAEVKPDSRNVLWQKLQTKHLHLLTHFAPANAFEEMITWTEQGKHWKFPIDNEAEMGAEENIGFHEHVFLDHHLKGFPTKGPIRHFMELVVVGLSKNPYITVQRKVENIEWFRTYFKEKEEVLKQTGAID